MKRLSDGRTLSPAREIAAVAVMTALLIGGQLAMSALVGVEVVTVLLLCFSWAFGPRAGALAAVAFSLLRCFIWGFYPSAIVLYIIYYPLFALTFGALGRAPQGVFKKFPVWAAVLIDVLIAAIACGAAVCAATDVLKISRLAVVMVKTLLWIIFALCCALFAFFNTLIVLQRLGRLKRENTLKVAVLTALATLFTICFTLLDDVITPLFMGWGLFSASSAAYFYSNFIALAPQTVCTIVTVSVMFLPLSAIFLKAAKRT